MQVGGVDHGLTERVDSKLELVLGEGDLGVITANSDCDAED